MTNGNDMAHPQIHSCGAHDRDFDQDYTEIWSEGGMTKYENFAKAAMQGLLSNPSVTAVFKPHEIAKKAKEHAEALIAELNK